MAAQVTVLELVVTGSLAPLAGLGHDHLIEAEKVLSDIVKLELEINLRMTVHTNLNSFIDHCRH
jgi:hypothetical protein